MIHDQDSREEEDDVRRCFFCGEAAEGSFEVLLEREDGSEYTVIEPICTDCVHLAGSDYCLNIKLHH